MRYLIAYVEESFFLISFHALIISVGQYHYYYYDFTNRAENSRYRAKPSSFRAGNTSGSENSVL